MGYNNIGYYCNNLFHKIMKKINLSITGCMGRMGKQLIKSSKTNNNFKLVSLTENKIINKKIAGIEPNLNNLKAF